MNTQQDSEKRLKRLEAEIKRLDILLVGSEKYEEVNKEEIDSRISEFKKDFEMTMGEAKKEIVTFTFGLISTIIGFLSLMLAIVILWINKAEIDTQVEYLLLALGIVAVVLFGCFVVCGILKNFKNKK